MKLKLLNGNNNFYWTENDLTVVILSDINSVGLKNWERETKLKFKKDNFGHLTTKPISALRVLKLLTSASTFSFKVSYTDNASTNCTLYLEIIERT